jgi:succinyl-diaminopimelate desuccinylase
MKLDAISLSQHLIKIRSYSGDCPEVLNFLNNYLTNIGFKCDIVSFEGDNSYKVNNLHAIYNPKKSNKTFYFAGHTDVVNEGDFSQWNFAPFEAIISDNKLYGRGAADMKCAIACFVVAAEEFIANNSNPDFGIGFLITNDEEADSINGTKKMLNWMKEKNLPISACIVGEPTNPNEFGEMIKIGRRGSISFNLKIIGRQGHIAYPDIACNPNTSMINVLKILKDHKFDQGNQFFDPTNLEISSITSQNLGSNVIPNFCEAAFNVRFNDLQTSQSIIDLVEYAVKKTVGEQAIGEKAIGEKFDEEKLTQEKEQKTSQETHFASAKYQLSYRVSGESFLSKPQKLAEIVVNSVEKISGKKPILSTTGGTSDARFIKDYADEVVEIGLINKTAHKIDEFSEISEINQLQKTYLEILKSF